MSDIHIMGLPLSITNRIRCKGAPSSRGFPEQGMGFFHKIPTFKERIEFASVALPSPNENGFAVQGSTSPNEWDSHRDGHPLSSKRLLASETTRGILRLPKWSVERETPIQKGSLASPSHHGRLRLQVDNVHNQLQANLEISMSDVLTLASTLKSRCSSLHIIFVDRLLLRIESPLLMLPPWSSSSNAAWIPVQAGLDPLYMTARVR